MPVYDFKKIVSDSYQIILTSVAIGLVAGYMLDFYSGKITAITLAMIPPINGIGGNIGSILGARISSELHLGTITPDFQDQSALRLNLTASASLGLLVFSFTGAIFFIISLLSGSTYIESLRIASIFFGSGMLLTGIISFTSITAAFLSYTRGIDPDNVVIPIVTTIVDVAGVVSLLIMVTIIGV